MMKVSDNVLAAADVVATKANADVILISGAMDADIDAELLCVLNDQERFRENLIVLLTTLGGSPDVSYKITRNLRNFYKNGDITVVVDNTCKSAGMLIVMGADEIAMSDMAELGPLDVQVLSREEVGEYNSGLTPLQALSSLRTEAVRCFEDTFRRLRFVQSFSTKNAAQCASEMTIGLFKPIYEQLDPMRLGEISRAMLIGMEYAKRVCRENVKDGTPTRLISTYPSHGFVIDRNEAKQLFSKVRPLTPEEKDLAKAAEGFAEHGMSTSPIISPLSFLKNESQVADDKIGANGHDNENDGNGNRKGSQDAGRPDGDAVGSSGASVLRGNSNQRRKISKETSRI